MYKANINRPKGRERKAAIIVGYSNTLLSAMDKHPGRKSTKKQQS
jgi:hypothetical protein